MKQHSEIIEKHLWNEFKITVEIEEGGWEGVMLYHEEIDSKLISKEELKKLPDPALFHMVSYEDEKMLVVCSSIPT